MFKNQSDLNQCIYWPFYRLMCSYKVYVIYFWAHERLIGSELVHWTKETKYIYIYIDGVYVCTYIAWTRMRVWEMLFERIGMMRNEKLNEYGQSIGACGVFYDFIEPREFMRDEMTNIWLVKHANGDLIFDEEYRNLPDYRNLKTTYASQANRNEIKNRFLDIKVKFL